MPAPPPPADHRVEEEVREAPSVSSGSEGTAVSGSIAVDNEIITGDERPLDGRAAAKGADGGRSVDTRPPARFSRGSVKPKADKNLTGSTKSGSQVSVNPKNLKDRYKHAVSKVFNKVLARYNGK